MRLNVYHGLSPEEENESQQAMAAKTLFMASHSDWSKVDFFSKYQEE